MKTLLLALLLAAAGLHAEPLRFALIGDTPYTDGERHLLPAMLEAIGTSGAAFVVHIGDIKSGSSVCSDELFADRLGVFNDAPLPVIYVPGDNEWTDCHRTSNGSYDPLERLDKIRSLFFAAPRSLGRRTLGLERQSEATPEHVRWRAGAALFVGLNVPGSDNNWGRNATPSAEYRQRMPLVLDWLRGSFAEAKRNGLRAIVIAIQANPDFRHYAAGTPHGAYREFLDALRAETIAFAGEVVLVHGDTHSQKIDQPLRDPVTGAPLPNFTRVETYGSPFMGWVSGVIDAAAPPRFVAHPFTPGPSLLP